MNVIAKTLKLQILGSGPSEDPHFLIEKMHNYIAHVCQLFCSCLYERVKRTSAHGKKRDTCFCHTLSIECTCSVYHHD